MIEEITIKEICDKLPDRVAKDHKGAPIVYKRNKNTVLELKCGRIVFCADDYNFKKVPSEQNIHKVIKNNHLNH